MLALVNCEPKRERDLLDAEFDAVYREARMKNRGGLFLVKADAAKKVVAAKADTSGLFVRMGDAVYDAVERMRGLTA